MVGQVSANELFPQADQSFRMLLLDLLDLARDQVFEDLEILSFKVFADGLVFVNFLLHGVDRRLDLHSVPCFRIAFLKLNTKFLQPLLHLLALLFIQAQLVQFVHQHEAQRAHVLLQVLLPLFQFQVLVLRLLQFELALVVVWGDLNQLLLFAFQQVVDALFFVN